MHWVGPSIASPNWRARISVSGSNESRELSNVFTESVVAPFELIARARSITKLADLVRLFAETADEDAILFLDEAYESAARSPYSGNLAGPARQLATLCTVAARYHLGDMSTGEDFKRAFERAGKPTSRAQAPRRPSRSTVPSTNGSTRLMVSGPSCCSAPTSRSEAAVLIRRSRSTGTSMTSADDSWSARSANICQSPSASD